MQQQQLWRQHSPSYDNNRAVQIPSTEPGHTVRRKRKSSETEYQYRKRQAVTSNSTNEESNQTVDEDEAAVTAMFIHRSLKFTMSLWKKDLVQLLQEHGPLKTKTIEDLRFTLMTVVCITTLIYNFIMIFSFVVKCALMCAFIEIVLDFHKIQNKYIIQHFIQSFMSKST
jgi:hypothetical protein